MQGRLSPRPPGRLQAFPSAWSRELEVAARLGFAFVEWLLLAPSDGPNPFRTTAGRRAIRRAASSAGIPIASVCAVTLMAEPLERLPEVIAGAAEIGATRVLVPLLEQAHIQTPERESEALRGLAAGLGAAEQAGVTLALELDLPGEASARVLRRLGHARVRACYDAGNFTALGLDVATDVRPVLDLLEEVHVKDRRRHGSSVPLGEGDTNFAGLFQVLRRSGYEGDFVLEHYFERDPEGEGARALGFVRRCLRDAGF